MKTARVSSSTLCPTGDYRGTFHHLRPFVVLVGIFAPFKDFGGLLGPDPEARRVPGTLPIRGSLATMSSQARSAACLEIWRIGRKDLPARDLLPKYLNGSHVPELAAQTLVVLLGGGKPHAVVRRLVALVAQYEDNLVLNVDREAAEHGASRRRQWSDRVEHELMRDDLALLDGEEGVLQREKGRVATTLRHRAYDIANFPVGR